MTTAREAQNVPPQTLCSAQQTWDIFQNSTLPGDCNGCFTICWADVFCIGLWWSRRSVAFFSLITRIPMDGEALEQVLEDLLDACAKLPLIDLLTVLPRLLSTDCNIGICQSQRLLDAIRCDEAWPIDWNLTSNKHQNRTRKDTVKYDTFNYHQCLAWRTQSQSDRSLQIFVRLVAWVATTWLLFWQLGSKTQFVGSLSAQPLETMTLYALREVIGRVLHLVGLHSTGISFVPSLILRLCSEALRPSWLTLGSLSWESEF